MITVKQALEALESLSNIIAGDRKDSFILSSAVRIRIAGQLRRLRPINEEFNTERNALLKGLGTLNKEGTSYDLGANKERFEAELKALLDEPTEINELIKLTNDELFGKPEGKQNQIDMVVVESLIGLGILPE